MKKIIILLISLFMLLLFFYGNNEATKKITGSATASAQVGFRILSDCNIIVTEGWNLVSICANMSNKSVSNALRDIEGKYRYILEWNESAQAFEVFSPLAAENPFNELNENKSYFIYLTELDCSVNAPGSNFKDMDVPLEFGWNSPTYPYEFNAEITKYLDKINESYRYLMVWNASSQKFILFSPLAAENELTMISSGQGQFIYITNTSGAIIKYNRSALE